MDWAAPFQDNMSGYPDITNKVEKDVKSNQTKTCRHINFRTNTMFHEHNNLVTFEYRKNEQTWSTL